MNITDDLFLHITKRDWLKVIAHPDLNEDIIRLLYRSYIEEYKDSWSVKQNKKIFSHKYLRRIITNINIKLSDSFLRDFAHLFNNDCFYWISRRDLNEQFIIDFADRLDWNYIGRYSQLSENFIYVYESKLRLDIILHFQNLSETYILRRVKDIDLYKMNWFNVWTKQKVSLNFIKTYINKPYVIDIFHNELYTKEEMDNIRELISQYLDLVLIKNRICI
jgi:hypothetical protein